MRSPYHGVTHNSVEVIHGRIMEHSFTVISSDQETLLLIRQHSGHVHVLASKIQRLNNHQASRAANCFSKNVNSTFRIDKITTS